MTTNKHFHIPPSGPPTGPRPSSEIYRVMGEAQIYQLLADFYAELEKSSIRHLFPDDMQEASKKSAAFFVFLLGGPPLYHQQYGSPMMRQRHMAFAIDEEARQIWLSCFRRVLIGHEHSYQFPIEHAQSFWDFLENFSAWMVNTKK